MNDLITATIELNRTYYNETINLLLIESDDRKNNIINKIIEKVNELIQTIKKFLKEKLKKIFQYYNDLLIKINHLINKGFGYNKPLQDRVVSVIGSLKSLETGKVTDLNSIINEVCNIIKTAEKDTDKIEDCDSKCNSIIEEAFYSNYKIKIKAKKIDTIINLKSIYSSSKKAYTELDVKLNSLKEDLKHISTIEIDGKKFNNDKVIKFKIKQYTKLISGVARYISCIGSILINVLNAKAEG